MKRSDKEQELNKEFQESIHQVADKMVGSVAELIRTAKTEEDLRIGFEKILSPLLQHLEIKSEPKYEKSILGGRSDALHGQVIIEYEKPGAFKFQERINHAYEQLIGYIQGEARDSKENLFLFGTRLIGVGFDGKQIFFVQYKGDKNKPKTVLDKNDFILNGPYPFNIETAHTFLTYLRALARLPLTAENLADKFGPKSKIAPMAVSAFADALEHWASKRVEVFFKEWKRLFGIVYGEQFSVQPTEEAITLSNLYGVGKETDFQELLFSVHTYFALLMKLIAAELITLKESAFTASFSIRLTHSSKDELKAQLTDIEDGGIYTKRGITNFLEGDFFRWYLDAFSPRLEEAIREITRGLSEFEPATTIINPESTRDLLKKLYQYLVPQEVRHKLGEYYTPDWLAELVLNEVGYDGNTFKRLLDPACGSGTFIVLAIQRAKEYGRIHKEPKLETKKRIVANIWGFDLNPLAVIAARTNYLFALGELVSEMQNLEIPIYLTDSVLTPSRITGGLFGKYFEVPTSVCRFQIPAEWVRDEAFLLSRAVPLIEEMIKGRFSVEEALVRFQNEGLVFSYNKDIIANFYRQILELEKQDKNGIWARFLKNAFASMIAGKFDFVVGNPPWIRWDYLSQDYRNATLPLWKDYGLFSLKGFQTRLGGGKKDFSMLFTYASADYYLKNGAKLGFLITQEVFKSKGAGEGFRSFRLGEQGKHLKILKALDLVTVQPFEGAANKTGAVILKKGETTTYPVPYLVWQKKKGVGKIPADKTLNEVLPYLQKRKLVARPMGSKFGAWQTVAVGLHPLAVIEGRNIYKAILGANPNPYGIFWLEIKQFLSDRELIVRNLTEEGKKIISTIEARLESDLVYPALRGADIQRWGFNQKIYMLVVQDPKTRAGYLEETMKKRWPKTFGYLTQFKRELLSRALYKKYHEHLKNPFYSQFNISEDTFSKYKVVWKAMSNDIYASVISQIKTLMGFKIAIPLHTTSFFATGNEDEAHYLCAIINSIPVREFIKSFSSAGRGFGTPSVMQHVGIPKFDPKNKLHQKLSQLSKTLYALKSNNKLDEIARLEKELDNLVHQLFGIKK